MEGPERMGAGPESTGTDDEQLRLFEAYEQYELDVGREQAPNEASALNGDQRLHSLRYRADRLRRDHFGARGDRLEADCARRYQRDN